MPFAQLFCLTNYSFLRGASHASELVERAYDLGYSALAITDECSLAGAVKAYITAKELDFPIIIGSEFYLSNHCHIVVLAPNKTAYAELSGFITLARRRSEKGKYEAHLPDLRFRLQNCLIIWLPQNQIDHTGKLNNDQIAKYAKELSLGFKHRLWIGIRHQLQPAELKHYDYWQKLGKQYNIPLVACPEILMHDKNRKPLQDTLTAIKNNTSVEQLGQTLSLNAESYLKSQEELLTLYPLELLEETQRIADLCSFSMDELRYHYPEELVPEHITPIQHLTNLVNQGKQQRWPEGVPEKIQAIIDKELQLILEMQYEYYFLTVHDIVQFARKENILCQGRGSAANSVICYCLDITEIRPGQINVLFERFISKERNEPPDIDVDFEHSRREEVVQYIYRKYTRERAALAASVVTYRPRSAIRDVGKALGLDPGLIDHIAKSLAWWDRKGDLKKRIAAAGLNPQQKLMLQFFSLVQQIQGFPRHLSQHVGGFVITQKKISDLVPMENASMPERTIIQWDKEDLEAVGLMKVDILALGMLTALRKGLHYVHQYAPHITGLKDIPQEDKATYNMLSAGDSIGVFQVESRAQMSMLPRLRPQCFYDLVIEIAIVRPGPIQGDMVHPYLRRRNKEEPVTYHNEELEDVLSSTLGVPIFQEQAIRLAMVAAGFSGGEADQLRRAMASWGKNGNLLKFEEKFIHGMLKKGYPQEFADRLFNQIKGFGGYGFPESHSASFALLCYASSWLKCHHPAAFYCALLNSQPMGFYSPSQLIQDARRHHVQVLPVEINQSDYENKLEQRPDTEGTQAQDWAIRLGFERIKTFNQPAAYRIVDNRRSPYQSLEELAHRAKLNHSEMQILASADALCHLSGNRHQSRWRSANIKPYTPLLHDAEVNNTDELFTMPPNLQENVINDYDMLGVSLRPHPMALLRQTYPFTRCLKQQDLSQLGNGRFARVAGLVTGRQRPGTAKGTVFLTLEDETGNINIVVWKNTQDKYRRELLTSQLLVVKGRLETRDNVIHIIAGQLEDYSDRLQTLDNQTEFRLKSRDFH
ncbi:error-prone DNA polymerase [Teredinibacter sp. KSP-S5-2]|uniref:error-prone DNA polymerase n=1 Tax=Teredinibacter sp. KSP-S5-2 TaxID=3034506 RepID=UPI0029346D8D|nr:error-prone DNA polymerase [Teredinibacter sp. KSP-S5-2]WNO09788.1 error-prone DNA polymerase [Teredinibacter sp. KSP-S5-2]